MQLVSRNRHKKYSTKFFETLLILQYDWYCAKWGTNIKLEQKTERIHPNLVWRLNEENRFRNS